MIYSELAPLRMIRLTRVGEIMIKLGMYQRGCGMRDYDNYVHALPDVVGVT